MNLKKLILALVIVFAAAVVFAEPASTGLTDSDVKNFAKNYETIYYALQEYGYSDPLSYGENASDTASVEKILEKNGISGPNRVNKLSMIGKCIGIAGAEAELAKDPESAAILKAMGMDPMADLKKDVNSKDLNVVTANYPALEKVIAKSEELEKKAKKNTASTKRADKNSYAGVMSQMVFGDDDEMDDETRALFEQMIMQQPGAQYAEQSWQSSNNMIKEQVDVQEKRGKEVKKLFDSLKSSKGDCGFIYKLMDKENASSYKATKFDAGKNGFLRVYGKEIEENDYDNMLKEIKFEFKTNKAKAVFSFFDSSWDKLKDKPFYEINVKDYITEKTYDFTVSKIELYSYEAERRKVDIKNPYGKEYIITTKEGAVIHILNGVSRQKDYKSLNYIWWKGLDKPIEIDTIGIEEYN